jgi:hypothetical protein
VPGRFLFANCNKAEAPRNSTCLGYDLTDFVGLAPPARAFSPTNAMPVAVAASPLAAMDVEDGLADGLGNLLDRDVDFSIGEMDFDEDDLFGDLW